MSSSSSTKFREGERKKPHFGFDEMEEELLSNQTLKNGLRMSIPEWARGMMNYLKLSIGSIKESMNGLKVEVEVIFYSPSQRFHGRKNEEEKEREPLPDATPWHF